MAIAIRETDELHMKEDKSINSLFFVCKQFLLYHVLPLIEISVTMAQPTMIFGLRTSYTEFILIPTK